MRCTQTIAPRSKNLCYANPVYALLRKILMPVLEPITGIILTGELIAWAVVVILLVACIVSILMWERR
jgi:uncharacterized protein YggT (Ycf19 family)